MNNETIHIEEMCDISQALSYFDGRLFDRLSNGKASSIEGMFSPIGLHLLAKAGEKIVGIVSFYSTGGGCLVIHPKIKQSCMIYAERICNAAIDYASKAGNISTVLAIIPTVFKANIKMAERCGFILSGMIPESFDKSGKLHDQLIYTKRLEQ